MTHKLAALLGGADAARFAVSLVASLGVHAGAALWADGWSRAPVREPLARSVQVRLVSAPAREVLAAVAPDPAARPAGEPPQAALALPPIAPAARGPEPIQALAASAAAAVSMPSTAVTARATPRLITPTTAPAAAPPAAPVQQAVAAAIPSRPPAPARTPQRARGARPAAAARAVPRAPAVASQPPSVAAPARAVDTPPQLAAGNAPPQYPTTARRRGQQGRVLLRLQVLPDGTISPPAVVRSSGVASLDRAAVAAVARWRFTPASSGGRAVAATVEVPVVFRLDGSG